VLKLETLLYCCELWVKYIVFALGSAPCGCTLGRFLLEVNLCNLISILREMPVISNSVVNSCAWGSFEHNLCYCVCLLEAFKNFTIFVALPTLLLFFQWNSNWSRFV
jgi:hypothetical protein